MSRPSRYAAGFAFLIAVASLAAGFGRTAGGAGELRLEPVQGPTRAFFTPDDCAACHDGRPSNRFANRDLPALARLDEFATWSRLDKHSRAYDALEGPRGRRMQTKLGLKDVTHERACLTCHSTGFLPDDPPSETSGAVEARGQGVGCTACHGSNLEWVQTHGLTGAGIRRWRATPPEEKSRVYGMTNLRDADIRASTCVACHVGDARSGRVVTHEMYAAGHPPLSAFQPAAYEAAMPRHWWTPDEVPLFQKDPEAKERFQPAYSAARDAIVGEVAVLLGSMRLLADRSSNVLDYAAYECSACHHELKSPGLRQRRQMRNYAQTFLDDEFPGVPGRPRLRSWPWATAGSWGAENAAPLREGMLELLRVVDAEPFGDPKKLAACAEKVAAASQRLLMPLEAAHLDSTRTSRILAALANPHPKASLEYDAARQIALSLQVHVAAWTSPPNNVKAIRDAVSELGKWVKLEPADATTRARVDEDPEVLDAFRMAAEFDEDAFQAALAKVAALLPGALPKPLSSD